MISQTRKFEEFLGLNKINFAKAEHLKHKKDGRVLPIFRLEIIDPTEVEALISQNLVCHVTGIVYKVEEFRTPFFSYAVLQLPMFRTFSENLWVKTEMSDLRRKSLTQRMPQ